MSLLSDLADLVLPRRCVGCGAPGVFCSLCRPTGAPLLVAGVGLPVVAGAAYADALRTAVLAYKERGRRDLAAPLSAVLAGALTALLGGVRDPPGRVVLVPVPSNHAAAAARGGDHVCRLARRAAAPAGVRVARGAVGLARAARDSAGLGSAERVANLDHAMIARPPRPGLVAVVVDDIVTTGATLRETARALSEAGWPVLGGAVVAATPRRSSTAWASHWQHPADRTSV
jgi:predicted amidophosphoribosyltransferase